MSFWNSYPASYRNREVDYILDAVSAGDCVAILGLSGSGKSNLMGFLAHRVPFSEKHPAFILVDCNRIVGPQPGAFYRLMNRVISNGPSVGISDSTDHEELIALESVLADNLDHVGRICLLLDRFDAIDRERGYDSILSNLRAFRDTWKYSLTYVTATRKHFKMSSELAELFYGRTLYLRPLSRDDALWSAHRDSVRLSGSGQPWDPGILETLVEVSWGYPSLLRACCEAFAAGASLTLEDMGKHPAVERRVVEFWSDEPTEEMLKASGIWGQPLLFSKKPATEAKDLFNTTKLTAKENLLLSFLLSREGVVCEKDELIQAVWPEDVIYEKGIRDDSLAQLVRRLRVKIEPDPNEPRYIQTIPGRGYLLRKK
jgi:hypothetical protein